MAKKPHKYAGTGVDIDTRLGQVELTAIAAQAAVHSTGDLWNGKQRIDESQRGDTWIHYVITNGVARWVQVMEFTVEFHGDGHRTTITTTIGDYAIEQTKALGIVPAGPKKMIGHHTYMQFVRHVANSVRSADPSAVIQLREGVETAPEGSSQPGGSAGTTMTKAAPALATPLPVVPPLAAQPQFAPQPEAAPAAPQFAPPPFPAADVTFEQFSPPTPMQPFDEEMWDAATVVVQGRGDAVKSTPGTDGPSLVAPSWELVLPDGRTVPMSDPVVVGRDPADSDRKRAQLLKVPEESRGVSKTHAVFEVVAGLLTVTDLHSSNGTVVLATAGAETHCAPDSQNTLNPGDEIELGDYIIGIRSIVAQRS